jgi:hypothetical protein
VTFVFCVYGKNPTYIAGLYYNLIRLFILNRRSRVIVLGHMSVSKFHSAVYTMFPNVAYYRIDEPRHLLPLFRYLPLCSELTGVWNIRDADSRYSIREQQILQQFLHNDSQFMTVKDCSSHFEWPILAGLFFAKRSFRIEPNSVIEFGRKYPHGPIDQMFLRDEIWKQISDVCTVHVPLDKAGLHFIGQGYTWLGVPLYPVDPSGPKYKEHILVSALGFLFTYILGSLLIPILLFMLLIRNGRNLLRKLTDWLV